MSAYEKKDKTRDGYVWIYECVKLFFPLTFERACASQETTINNMKEIVHMYKSDIEEIHATNQDMQGHIDIFHKQSESCAAYP